MLTAPNSVVAVTGSKLVTFLLVVSGTWNWGRSISDVASQPYQLQAADKAEHVELKLF